MKQLNLRILKDPKGLASPSPQKMPNLVFKFINNKKQYFLSYNFYHYSITELSSSIKHKKKNMKLRYHIETLVKMINNHIQFISNNVKGLQSLEKRIKVFEYLKNCISNNGFLFLQETHSIVFDEKDELMR